MSKSIAILEAISFLKLYEIDTINIKNKKKYNKCVKIFIENTNDNFTSTQCSGMICKDCILLKTNIKSKDGKPMNRRYTNCSACHTINNGIGAFKQNSDTPAVNYKLAIYKLWKLIEKYRDIIIQEDL